MSSNKVLVRVVVAVIAVCLFGLYGESVATNCMKPGCGAAKTIVAQRYPLRSRSNDFYNRSKISNKRSGR